jgi:Ceramidase
MGGRTMSLTYPNPHPPSCPWHHSAELFGAPNIKWCETTLCSWISEPANTWSNLLYLVMALVIHFQCRHASHVELRRMAPAMAVMGLLSGLYHASNNYLTQVFDFLGMFLLTFWLLVINLRRNAWLEPRRQALAYGVLVLFGLLAVHLMYRKGLPFQVLIALAALAIIGTEFMARRRVVERVSLRHFLAGMVLMALAQAASLADLSRALCDPDNHFVQGHAVWHLVSALALYFSVQHYRQLHYPHWHRQG